MPWNIEICIGFAILIYMYICHFDIHVYIYIYYKYIYVCLCVYTSLLKKMFWMNIHLPAIFDLAEQVLRLHKHLTWTAMEGQTY